MQIGGILALIWIALAVASSAFFFLCRNAPLKQKLWRPYLVTAGMVVVSFPLLMGFPWQVLFVLIPVAILAMAGYLRAVRFCMSCGKTVMSPVPWSKPDVCSKCGARLPD